LPSSFAAIVEASQETLNRGLERWKLLLHDVPDHRIGDDLIVVAQDARALIRRTSSTKLNFGSS